MKTNLFIIGSLGLGLWLAREGLAQGEFRSALPVRSEAAPVRPAELPLTFAEINAFQRGRNYHELPAPRAEEKAAAEAAAFNRFGVLHPGPKRVGFTRPVGARALGPQHGSTLRQAGADGRDTWTMAVRSTGAAGLRLHFTRMDLGDGAMLLF